MDLLRFVPIKLTLLLVLGILLGRYLQPSVFLPLTFTGVFLLLLGFLFYKEKRSPPLHGKGPVAFGITMALTALSIGILAVSLTSPDNLPNHYSHKNFTGNRLWKVKNTRSP